MTHPLKIAKLADASRVEFGPLSFYHPLVADGDTPVRTGIQTSAPGYVAPMHFHPYTELLFIIEGEADVWIGDTRATFGPGQLAIVPAGRKHGFTNTGSGVLHIRSTLASPVFEAAYDDKRETPRRWLPSAKA